MDNRFLLPMMYLSLIVLYQNSDAQNITASYKMDEIDSLVNIIDSDAELLYVKSDSVTLLVLQFLGIIFIEIKMMFVIIIIRLIIM